MVYQYEHKLKPEIKQWGCYFLSILKAIEEYKELNITADDVNSFYETALKTGLINQNCMVLNGSKLFAFYGIKVIQLTGQLKEKPSRINTLLPFDEKKHFSFGEWNCRGRDFNHFTYIKGNRGQVDYWDSWGASSIKNVMIGKRVYKIVE